MGAEDLDELVVDNDNDDVDNEDDDDVEDDDVVEEAEDVHSLELKEPTDTTDADDSDLVSGETKRSVSCTSDDANLST